MCSTTQLSAAFTAPSEQAFDRKLCLMSTVFKSCLLKAYGPIAESCVRRGQLERMEKIEKKHPDFPVLRCREHSNLICRDLLKAASRAQPCAYQKLRVETQLSGESPYALDK